MEADCQECEKCGLYSQVQTYCIYPEQDMRPKTQGKPVALVLYSHPWKQDDNAGIPLAGKLGGGQFLRKILNDMSCKWVLSSAVRCFTGGTPYKRDNPKAVHIRSCVSTKLVELIELTAPAVIVSLGAITMKAVLGRSSPPSLAKGKGTAHYVEVGGRQIPVLLADDPATMTRDDKADQVEEYEAVFAKAAEIAESGYTRKQYKYHLIESVNEFTELVEGLGKKICLDFEFHVHKNLPTAKTIHHKDSKPLLANISEFVDELVENPVTDEVHTFLVPPKFFTCHDHWKRLLQNRHVVGHNLKVEWNCLWRYCGQVCPYELAGGLAVDGEYLARDTLLRANALDCGVRGISLKKISMKHLGVEDWSVQLHTEIRDANQRIAQAHKDVSKEITKRLKAYTTNRSKQTSQQYREAKRFLKTLRPKGSATFGDPSFATLCEYGAADSENNIRIDHLIPETDQPLAELQQRSLYVTTMIERNGLPVDMAYARKLRKAYRRRYKELMHTLLQYPVVRQVVVKDEKVRKAVSANKLDWAMMLKLMSPFRKAFLRDLAVATGVIDRVPPSPKKIPLLQKGEITREEIVEKGDLGFEEDVLTDLCGGSEDTKPEHRLPSWAAWEDKTEVQRLWAHIYEFRQLFGIGNKSVKPIFEYTVDGVMRTDFRLTATESDGDSSEGGGATTGRLACIAKGSLIQAACDRSKYPDGIPIEDIREGDLVYGYSKKGRLLLQRVKWAGQTGTKKTLRIKWKGGGRKTSGELLLTPEHRVRLLDGSWIRADQLEQGHRIMALSNGESGWGYSRLYAKGGKEIKEHRFIMQQLGYDVDGLHVHHIDENKMNNHPSNLRMVTPSEHVYIHLPDAETLRERGKYLHTPEARRRQKEAARRGSDAHNWRELTRIEILRGLARAKGRPTVYTASIGMDYETFQKKCASLGLKYQNVVWRYNGAGEFISRGRFKREMHHPYVKISHLMKSLRMSSHSIRRMAKYYNVEYSNHYVEAIEEGPVVPVYDITVDGIPCYIANQLAVHNSSEPNLTNLKKDNVIRRAFSAAVYGDDWMILESDYDRIEPVMLTVVANIKLWKRAFRNGWDLYQVIANEVYHLGIDLSGDPAEAKQRLETAFEVNGWKPLRENAKTRTLAIMYDESPAAFARRANITIEDAKEFFRKFAENYPEIDRYKRRIRLQVRRKQQIHTWWGRKRLFKLPPRHWSNYRSKFNSTCRQAINFPIQEMAASTMIWKAYEVMRWIKKKKWDHLVKVINIIHDALMFAVHRSIAAEFMAGLKKILEDTSTLPFAKKFVIPLKTGYKAGLTWGDMRELKTQDYQAEVDKTFALRKEKR